MSCLVENCHSGGSMHVNAYDESGEYQKQSKHCKMDRYRMVTYAVKTGSKYRGIRHTCDLARTVGGAIFFEGVRYKLISRRSGVPYLWRVCTRCRHRSAFLPFECA